MSLEMFPPEQPWAPPETGGEEKEDAHELGKVADAPRGLKTKLQGFSGGHGGHTGTSGHTRLTAAATTSTGTGRHSGTDRPRVSSSMFFSPLSSTVTACVDANAENASASLTQRTGTGPFNPSQQLQQPSNEFCVDTSSTGSSLQQYAFQSSLQTSASDREQTPPASTITALHSHLPGTSSRDTLRAPRLLSGIDRQSQHQQLPGVTSVSQTPLQSNLSSAPRPAGNNTIVLSAQESITASVSEFPRTLGGREHSTDASLSSPTMGYKNGTNLPSAWSVTPNASPKMEAQEEDRSYRSTERKEHDDDSTVRSLDSNNINSPPIMPRHSHHAIPEQHHTVAGSYSASGTPSTISTAPSTDAEFSSHGLDPNAIERLAVKMDAAYNEGARYHRRVPSWEGSPQHFDTIDIEHAFGAHALPPAWGTAGPLLQQRVASFRAEQDAHNRYGGFPRMNSGGSQWQHQQQRYGSPDPQLPFLPTHQGRPGAVDTRIFRQPQEPQFHHPYQAQQRNVPGAYVQAQLPPSGATPPRNARPQRLVQSPQRPPQVPPTGSGMGPGHMTGNSRSASEVLKTLLRKKACLYEPDTSRAVALVTWLVGRELALDHGFFSRQQLQAGVHSCVADKIESGAITRTKVNRCMQIILNSCFHYIIPRPDGSEENGSVFQSVFEKKAQDDSFLLQVLPIPWNDLTVDRGIILEAAAVEFEAKVSKRPSPSNTPKSSPRLGPVDKGSPGKDSLDGGESGDYKRAVLLCFNENVRCAEDVFRCHNEFIRDTAHASHLQMSSQEWRLFFGQAAASARFIWGNVGIPVPHSESRGGPMQTDALGMMTDGESAKFRSCWCTKRYDHNHDLCGFAHAEINGGWLRRNPFIHNYKDEMCTDVSKMADERITSAGVVINECPHGMTCDFAHSMEEITYHPKNYKSKPCPSVARQSGCSMGDVCPHFHPAESFRFPKKSDGRGYGTRHSKHPQHSGGHKGAPAPLPTGSPIMYASPAPVSSFEQNFALPGLQNLFRRHCSVVRAHLRTPGGKPCTCCYSYFGDDSGVNVDPASRPKPAVGLPQPVRT